MTPGVPGALEPRMYPRSRYFLVYLNDPGYLIIIFCKFFYDEKGFGDNSSLISLKLKFNVKSAL